MSLYNRPTLMAKTCSEIRLAYFETALVFKNRGGLNWSIMTLTNSQSKATVATLVRNVTFDARQRTAFFL